MRPGFDRRLLVVVAALVLVALAPATVASAARPERVAVVPHATAGGFAGPRVAGDLVAWAQLRGTRWQLRLAEAGGRTQSLGELRDRPGAGIAIEFSGAATAFAVGPDVYAAATPGVLGPIPFGERCASDGNRQPLAVGGTRVAWLADCRPQPGGGESLVIRIRDVLVPGPPTDIPLTVAPEEERPVALRLAGGRLAFEQGYDDATGEHRHRVIVLDLSTGGRRVAWEDEGEAPDGSSGLTDVQAWALRVDGALALGTRWWPDHDAYIGWVDPAGTWKPLVEDRPAAELVRFAGDDVAAVAAGPKYGPRPARTILVADTDGRSVRRLARFERLDPTSNAPRLVGFDATAGRVAWAERVCAEDGGERVTVRTLALRGLGLRTWEPPRPACPLANLDQSLARVDRDGRFTLHVSCSQGCKGGITVPNVALFGAEIRHFRFPASRRSHPVRMRLDPVARRSLARRGELGAHISVFTRLGDGERARTRSALRLLPKR